ncbi:hypothetical protein [Actinomadura macrotermitis]|uniref:DUF1877 family protein n=1 Tax=Actinomadura macrotermitis TaxID=2585200 RepID=A0A7K0C7H4_9ACTN|nr:hypothetical protein [Actinomadura macrotermitis]MQY09062.1 hypothetical protein [Actinomadura macrotermitis]
MAVIFEYFRAPDRGAALRLLKSPEGVPEAPGTAADSVETKRIDPTVVLGQLLAQVLGVPWDAGLVPSSLVWPQGEPEPDEDGGFAEDDPWSSGVTVEELGDVLRDGLAGIADADLPVVAGRWAGIGELGDDPDPEELTGLLGELVALARRAQGAGEHLYSWCCV